LVDAMVICMCFNPLLLANAAVILAPPVVVFLSALPPIAVLAKPDVLFNPAFAPIKEKFSGGVVYKEDFYKSKSGMFVEKRERRIKSSGELQEITFKGIMSKKSKKKKSKLFGGV
jgi:hypothetical protein